MYLVTPPFSAILLKALSSSLRSDTACLLTQSYRNSSRPMKPSPCKNKGRRTCYSSELYRRCLWCWTWPLSTAWRRKGGHRIPYSGKHSLKRFETPQLLPLHPKDKTMRNLRNSVNICNMYTLLRSAISEIWSQKSLIIIEYRVKLKKIYMYTRKILSPRYRFNH